MSSTKKRTRTRKDKKSNKDVTEIVEIVEKVMTGMLDSRFKMMDSLFKTTKPPEEWDYSEFESEDFNYEFQSRPSLVEDYPDYKDFTDGEKEKILKADDGVEETKERLIKINKLMNKFRESTNTDYAKN